MPFQVPSCPNKTTLFLFEYTVLCYGCVQRTHNTIHGTILCCLFKKEKKIYIIQNLRVQCALVCVIHRDIIRVLLTIVMMTDDTSWS